MWKLLIKSCLELWIVLIVEEARCVLLRSGVQLSRAAVWKRVP